MNVAISRCAAEKESGKSLNVSDNLVFNTVWGVLIRGRSTGVVVLDTLFDAVTGVLVFATLGDMPAFIPLLTAGETVTLPAIGTGLGSYSLSSSLSNSSFNPFLFELNGVNSNRNASPPSKSGGVSVLTFKLLELPLELPLALPFDAGGGTGVVELNDFLATFFSFTTGVCFTLTDVVAPAAAGILFAVTGRVAGAAILFFGDLVLAALLVNEGIDDEDDVTIVDTFLGIELMAAATIELSLLVMAIGDLTVFGTGAVVATILSGLGLDAVTFFGITAGTGTPVDAPAAAPGAAPAILSIDGCNVRLVAGGKSRMILSILEYLIVPFFTNEIRHSSPC